MMKLTYDNTTQQGDLVRDDGNFETDESLETALTISLFTNRRARAEDGLSPSQDPFGWWGSAYLLPEGEIGSRLWLLGRSKTTVQALNRAKAWAEEALSWLVADGVAAAVTVVVEKLPGRKDTALLTVQVQRPRKSTPRFDRAWEVQLGL